MPTTISASSERVRGMRQSETPRAGSSARDAGARRSRSRLRPVRLVVAGVVGARVADPARGSAASASRVGGSRSAAGVWVGAAVGARPGGGRRCRRRRRGLRGRLRRRRLPAARSAGSAASSSAAIAQPSRITAAATRQPGRPRVRAAAGAAAATTGGDGRRGVTVSSSRGSSAATAAPAAPCPCGRVGGVRAPVGRPRPRRRASRRAASAGPSVLEHDLLERLPRLGRRARPVLRRLLEQPGDPVGERARGARGGHGQRRRRVLDVAEEDRDRLGVAERGRARDQLERDDADRVEVRPRARSRPASACSGAM